MAAGSAIAKKIAEYLAKGQVKKAARLEADLAARQTIWRINEDLTMAAMRRPAGSPMPPEEVAKYSHALLAKSNLAAYNALRARGYSKEAARKLAHRLSSRANNDIWEATEMLGSAPPPKIAPTIDPYGVRNTQPGDIGTFMDVQRRAAQMPSLHTIPNMGTSKVLQQQLNVLYGHLPEHSLVEFNGRMYRKAGLLNVPQNLTGTGDLTPEAAELGLGSYWLPVEAKGGLPLSGRRERE